MEIMVKQSKLKSNYEYKIYSNSNLMFIGKVNRVFFPMLRKISLTNIENKEICTLKQENRIKLFIEQIPIIGWLNFSACPYILYINETRVGYLSENKIQGAHISGEVYGESFEVWEHTGNNISFHSNGRQVGLIKRKAFKQFDGDEYKVVFCKKLRLELVSAITILADILFHTNDKSANALSWEYTIQLWGKKYDKNWRPSD